MNGEAGELHDIVRKIIVDNEYMECIGPTWVATQAMTVLLFPEHINPRVYLSAHLNFRQMARSMLRELYRGTPWLDDTAKIDEPDLFETLQHRYPKPPIVGEEPLYILRGSMTMEDYLFNISRLEKTSAALAKHAAALREECMRKFGGNVVGMR